MKAICFDFGNVVGYFSYRKPLERLRRHTDLNDEQILEAIGGELQEDYESGRLTSDEFLRRAVECCCLRCSAEELAMHYANIFWPNEDVCAMLPKLRGRYRLLLGSNTCDLHARQFKRQFADPLANFDSLVLSHEIGDRKPKAAFFEHVQRLAGCPPEECLFIDDLPANIEGAKACGWHGIVYVDASDLRNRMRNLGVAL
jgi:putative hydrolase of the HAD superfamily